MSLNSLIKITTDETIEIVMNKKLITLAVQSAIFSAATMMTSSTFAIEKTGLTTIEKN